jgi:hypothetical protein
MFHKESTFIDPPIWGKHFWTAIESIIISMDIAESQSVDSVYLFLISLQNTLPCPTCRLHYQDYCSRFSLKENIFDKKLMFQWIYNLQKEIQQRNNRPMIDFDTYMENVKTKFQLI